MNDKHIFYRSQFEKQRDEGWMMIQDWLIANIYPWLEAAFIWYLIGIPVAFLLTLCIGSIKEKEFIGIKAPLGYALAWPIFLIGFVLQSKLIRKLWNG